MLQIHGCRKKKATITYSKTKIPINNVCIWRQWRVLRVDENRKIQI